MDINKAILYTEDCFLFNKNMADMCSIVNVLLKNIDT